MGLKRTTRDRQPWKGMITKLHSSQWLKYLMVVLLLFPVYSTESVFSAKIYAHEKCIFVSGCLFQIQQFCCLFNEMSVRRLMMSREFPPERSFRRSFKPAEVTNKPIMYSDELSTGDSYSH